MEKKELKSDSSISVLQQKQQQQQEEIVGESADIIVAGTEVDLAIENIEVLKPINGSPSDKVFLLSL